MKTQMKEILQSDRPLSEKIRYFLGYHFKTILGVLAGIVVIVAIVWQMLHPAPQPELTAAVVGSDENLAVMKKVASEDPMLEKLLTPSDSQQVYYVSDADADVRQKYVLLLAAGDMDLVIMNKTELDMLEADGGLVNLAEKLPELKADDPDTDPYALSVNYWLDTEELADFYLVIPVNSQNIEKTLEKIQ
ncbi:hypothetical protein [Enterococcus timonensis]|uniref:hypothetical protein n=1 Tax=Enterococcus timonensis TaxID=1852364 RepID=UPI0008D8E412|nr:hypothetical protein [Enterococcus timonensis]